MMGVEGDSVVVVRIGVPLVLVVVVVVGAGTFVASMGGTGKFVYVLFG